MSTLKTDAIENGGAAVNFTTNVQAGGGFAKREYYEQASEPSGANNAAVWYDTANNELKLKINGFWYEVSITPPPIIGDRGIFGGGVTINTINYISIPTTGNASDFGNLTVARYFTAACSNGSRGVFGGGEQTGTNNTIDYITIATPGNAVDFGDLTVARGSLGSCSDFTRGLFGGGSSVNTNTIDYITIATPGNAIDFGDLSISGAAPAACSNQVRGLFSGYVNQNHIDYVTIQTLGNATNFGDLTVGRYAMGAASDLTRAVFGGGSGTDGASGDQDVIDYVTISTTGSATDFGNLTVARNYLAACSNGTRAVFGGGRSSVNLDTLDYVTVATVGNATDFGDLTESMWGPASCSGD